MFPSDEFPPHIRVAMATLQSIQHSLMPVVSPMGTVEREPQPCERNLMETCSDVLTDYMSKCRESLVIGGEDEADEAEEPAQLPQTHGEECACPNCLEFRGTIAGRFLEQRRAHPSAQRVRCSPATYEQLIAELRVRLNMPANAIPGNINGVLVVIDKTMLNKSPDQPVFVFE